MSEQRLILVSGERTTQKAKVASVLLSTFERNNVSAVYMRAGDYFRAVTRQMLLMPKTSDVHARIMAALQHDIVYGTEPLEGVNSRSVSNMVSAVGAIEAVQQGTPKWLERQIERPRLLDADVVIANGQNMREVMAGWMQRPGGVGVPTLEIVCRDDSSSMRTNPRLWNDRALDAGRKVYPYSSPPFTAPYYGDLKDLEFARQLASQGLAFEDESFVPLVLDTSTERDVLGDRIRSLVSQVLELEL